jgi:chromosome segregation ATPase
MKTFIFVLDQPMKKYISISILFITAIILIAGCGSKEVTRLQAENDSLRKELDTRYSVVVTMKEIKGLLDSIDQSRNALHVNLYEGTTYQDFTDRLGNINQYVKRTEDKIKKIEGELKSTSGKASAYLVLVDALKDELSSRTTEVEELETQVNNYKKENKGLVKTVDLQKSEIGELYSKISVKQQELVLIETKVNELVHNFKITEAEATYAHAQSVEEAAKRTKLAPNKKKETYKEALVLYKKALTLGNEKAREKIEEIEKKLK